jgi:hypothetical protein
MEELREQRQSKFGYLTKFESVRIRRFRFRPPSSTLTFPGAIYLEIVGAAAVSGLLSIEID